MIEPIKFDVSIGGISNVQSAFKTVEKSSADMAMRVQHNEEKTAQRIKEIHSKLSADIQKLNFNDLTKSEENLHKKVSLESNAANQIKNIQDRAAMSARHLRENEMAANAAAANAYQTNWSKAFSTVGHLAQAAGMYRLGHMLRAEGVVTNSLIGSSGGRGGGMGGAAGLAGAEEASAGLASLAAVALPVGLALGAIFVASKIVELGFNALAGVVESTAQSFAGAVVQIGGARNLQEMLVEAATNERLSAGMGVNFLTRQGTKEVMAETNRMSENSEFTPEQVTSGRRSYLAKTGESLEGKLGDFATKLASAADLTMEQVGGILGQMKVLGLNDQQTMQTVANMWMQGKAGAVELKDTEHITQALTFARKAGKGDVVRGSSMEMGAVQLAQKGIGGQSADEAVTSVRRFQQDIEDPKKTAKMQSRIGGGNIISHLDTGEAVYTNFNDTLARTALLQWKDPGALKAAGFDARAMRLPAGIAAYAANTPEFQGAKNDTERLKVLKDLVDSASNAKYALDELDGAFKQVEETTQYKMKQAFNVISLELESALLPVLKDVVPFIEALASTIKEHEPEIGSAFSQIEDVVLSVIPMIGYFGIMLAKVSAYMTETFGAAIKKEQQAERLRSQNKIDSLTPDIEWHKQTLAGGVETAGANKGKPLSPERIAKLTAEIPDLQNKLDLAKSEVARETMIIDSIDHLKDNADKFIDMMTKQIDEASVKIAQRMEQQISTKAKVTAFTGGTDDANPAPEFLGFVPGAKKPGVKEGEDTGDTSTAGLKTAEDAAVASAAQSKAAADLSSAADKLAKAAEILNPGNPPPKTDNPDGPIVERK